MTTTVEQLKKLPKHAQETISSLYRELNAAKNRIEELEAELAPVTDTPSRVYYETSLMDDGKRPMPEGAYFHFRLDHGEVRVMLQRSRETGSYFIDMNADQSLIVRPGATNSIRVTTEGRFKS